MSDAQIIVEIPVANPLTDWFGEPIVLDRMDDQGRRTPLPDLDQPTVGQRLRMLLNAYRSDAKPTMSIYAERGGRRIARAERAKEPYRAGQLALNILQEAWKQNAMLPGEHPGRMPNLVAGRIATIIGLTPPDEGLPLTGLEPLEEDGPAEDPPKPAASPDGNAPGGVVE